MPHNSRNPRRFLLPFAISAALAASTFLADDVLAQQNTQGASPSSTSVKSQFSVGEITATAFVLVSMIFCLGGLYHVFRSLRTEINESQKATRMLITNIKQPDILREALESLADLHKRYVNINSRIESIFELVQRSDRGSSLDGGNKLAAISGGIEKLHKDILTSVQGFPTDISRAVELAVDRALARNARPPMVDFNSERNRLEEDLIKERKRSAELEKDRRQLSESREQDRAERSALKDQNEKLVNHVRKVNKERETAAAERAADEARLKSAETAVREIERRLTNENVALRAELAKSTRAIDELTSQLDETHQRMRPRLMKTGAPLASWWQRIQDETAADGQVLLLKLHAFDVLATTGNSEAVLDSAYEVGLQLYKYLMGKSADERFAIAASWAEAMQSEIGELGRIQVVRPGEATDPLRMSFKPGVSSAADAASWAVFHQGTARRKANVTGSIHE